MRRHFLDFWNLRGIYERIGSTRKFARLSILSFRVLKSFGKGQKVIAFLSDRPFPSPFPSSPPFPIEDLQFMDVIITVMVLNKKRAVSLTHFSQTRNANVSNSRSHFSTLLLIFLPSSPPSILWSPFFPGNWKKIGDHADDGTS